MKAILPILLLASTSALAINDSEVIRKLDPAWRSVEEKTVALVGSDYQKTMVDAAFASVAVSACPGLAFKSEEVNKRFSNMVSDKGGKTPQEQQDFSVKASVLYGTYLGLLIAESHLDTPVFCEYVEKAKTKKGGPNDFWATK